MKVDKPILKFGLALAIVASAISFAGDQVDPTTPESVEIGVIGKRIEPTDSLTEFQALRLMLIAVQYQQSGRHADAARICKALLRSARDAASNAYAASCLAISNVGSRHFDDAETLVRQLLATSKRGDDRDRLQHAQNLRLLASLYRSRGFLVLADKVLQNALVILEVELVPRLPHDLVSPTRRQALKHTDREESDRIMRKLDSTRAEFERFTKAESIDAFGGQARAEFEELLAERKRLVDELSRILDRGLRLGYVSNTLEAHLAALRDRWEIARLLGREEDAFEQLIKLVQLGSQYRGQLIDVDAVFAIARELRRRGRNAEGDFYMDTAEFLSKRDLGYPGETADPLPDVFSNPAAESMFGTVKRSGLIAESVARLGRIYAETGRYEQAQRFLEAALEGIAFASGSDSDTVASLMIDLAHVERSQGHYASGFGLLRRTMQAILSRRDEGALLPPGRTIGVQNAEERLALELIDAIFRQEGIDALSNEEKDGLLFDSFQLLRRSSTEAAVTEAAIRRAQNDPKQKALVDRLQNATRELAGLRQKYALAATELGDGGSMTANLNGLGVQVEAQRAVVAQIGEDFGRASPINGLAFDRGASLSDIQRVLYPNEVLIQFAYGFEKGYVLATTRDKQVLRTIARGRRDIRSDVNELLESMSLRGVERPQDAKPFPKQIAYRLYRDSLGPIENEIKDGARLLLAADGPFEGFPFSTLLRSRPPESAYVNRFDTLDWVVRHYELVYLPSPRSLIALRSQKRSQGSKSLVGFGSPIIPSNASLEAKYRGGIIESLVVSPLEIKQVVSVAAGELEQIRKIIGFDSSSIYVGPRATKAALQGAKLRDYKVVVFATHGYLASRQSGLAEPGLLLSASSDGNEPSYLTTSEVALLRLDANLVLLNACDTAGADGLPGAEALSGFARAFFFAGARAVVVSLWPIADTIAKSVAVEMFRTATARPSLGSAAALRLAMLAVLRGSPGEFKHPAFWAPYIIVGDGAVRPI